MKTKPDYGEFMDPECIPLCDALNSIRGITTKESCCGHGKNSFHVWLLASFPRALFVVGRAISRPFAGFESRWTCNLFTWDVRACPVEFMLTSNGVKGEQADMEAELISFNIRNILANEPLRKRFSLREAEEWAKQL